MNKAKLNKDTVKILSFVNNKGEVTAKGKYLIDLLLKGISLKEIGCNFVVNKQYKNDTFDTFNRKGEKEQNEKTSNSISDNEIIHLCNMFNSSVATDFVLYCYYNKNNQVVIQKFDFDIGDKVYYISDKDSSISFTEKVHNAIDNSYTLNVVQKKGKRLLKEDDKKEIVAIFNNALKRLDKELFSLSSDDKKETKKVSA